eukprot:gb/GFBE01061873.1/.p1 GENE.gb/GFBE01061873.1/~~gb/GFBE01061873.1/.p1  ORF type:complete len:435 (+),score=52.01 gb/GFBE01061873.1/:1-1305(+)
MGRKRGKHNTGLKLSCSAWSGMLMLVCLAAMSLLTLLKPDKKSILVRLQGWTADPRGRGPQATEDPTISLRRAELSVSNATIWHQRESAKSEADGELSQSVEHSTTQLDAAGSSIASGPSSARPQESLTVKWKSVRSKAEKTYCEFWSRRKPRLGWWDEPAGYSMIWHYMLPSLVKALKQTLPPTSSAFNTLKNGDMYLFGVAQGESMKLMHRLFKDRRIFGFDSFIGLPPEDHKDSKIDAWSPGAFPGARTKSFLINSAGGGNIAKVYRGFFNESLSPSLASKEHFGPAFYIDIDCDLHSSTYHALDFMLAHGLARVGTVIGYDDWWTIPCRKYHHAEKGKRTRHLSPLSVGEGLAHQQLSIKYNISFRCIAGPCKPVKTFRECNIHNNWAPVFIIESVGRMQTLGGHQHGFEFTPEDEQAWITDMSVCPTVG